MKIIKKNVSSFKAMWIIAGCLMCATAVKLGSETLLLTTYYPAPYGVYAKIVTTDKTILARDDGRVGIGTDNPGSKLSVKGRTSLGNNYAAANGPQSGLIVEGFVGIGTPTPIKELDVNGYAKVKDIWLTHPESGSARWAGEESNALIQYCPGNAGMSMPMCMKRLSLNGEGISRTNLVKEVGSKQYICFSAMSQNYEPTNDDFVGIKCYVEKSGTLWKGVLRKDWYAAESGPSQCSYLCIRSQ